MLQGVKVLKGKTSHIPVLLIMDKARAKKVPKAIDSNVVKMNQLANTAGVLE